MIPTPDTHGDMLFDSAGYVQFGLNPSCINCVVCKLHLTDIGWPKR